MHAQGCQGPTRVCEAEPRVGVCSRECAGRRSGVWSQAERMDTRLSAWDVGLFYKEVIQ